ncbi:MAG: response regulator transcription factor [Phormidesmis sp.]
MFSQTLSRTGKDVQTVPRRTQLKHIMIIADELELAESLQIDLNNEGYQVSVIHDGMRGLLAVKRIATDLVIVGWSPPRLSGVEICHRLRLGRSEEPIILLTRGDSAEDRIAGLEAGANDCISLPFFKEEFLARIHASLAHQRRRQGQASVLRCADLQLNRETREVFRGDRFIRLTAKEFDLLEYLMEHYFQVLSRTQILEHVWGYEYFGSSNIIEVYIRYLRKKLDSTKKNRLIHTVRSVGYILREEVSEKICLERERAS